MLADPTLGEDLPDGDKSERQHLTTLGLTYVSKEVVTYELPILRDSCFGRCSFYGHCPRHLRWEEGGIRLNRICRKY